MAGGLIQTIVSLLRSMIQTIVSMLRSKSNRGGGGLAQTNKDGSVHMRSIMYPQRSGDIITSKSCYGDKKQAEEAKFESSCNCFDHTPCFCPFSPECAFTASSRKLYRHVMNTHDDKLMVTRFTYGLPFYVGVTTGGQRRRVILQEETDGIIFILNNHDDRVLSIYCIGPPRLDNAFTYKLIVRCNGGTRFSMKTIPKVYTKWEKHDPNNKPCLSLTNVEQQFLHVEVCIELNMRGWYCH